MPRQNNRIGALSSLAGLIFLAFAVASCAAPDAGPRTLTADEIRQTVTGTALSRCGNRLIGPWQYTARHRRDGTMEAVVLAGTRREDATGTWRVTGDDLYCRTWSNGWAQGREGCFRVTRNGATLTFDHVSGAAGESVSDTYTMAESCD